MAILDVQLKSVSRRVKDMGLEPLQVPNDTSPECEACREALAKGAFRVRKLCGRKRVLLLWLTMCAVPVPVFFSLSQRAVFRVRECECGRII